MKQGCYASFVGHLQVVLQRYLHQSGAYSESYSYNQIGNMLTRNGVSYTYPTNGVRPHAVGLCWVNQLPLRQ
jgi:hypothetical protein